jgi:hypothetical protein
MSQTKLESGVVTMKKKFISGLAALSTFVMLSLPLSLNAANGPDLPSS